MTKSTATSQATEGLQGIGAHVSIWGTERQHLLSTHSLVAFIIKPSMSYNRASHGESIAWVCMKTNLPKPADTQCLPAGNVCVVVDGQMTLQWVPRNTHPNGDFRPSILI
eukprot:1157306-Pelagomonas_calceolata.AAC.1